MLGQEYDSSQSPSPAPLKGALHPLCSSLYISWAGGQLR